jgi:hypothetical protein
VKAQLLHWAIFHLPSVILHHGVRAVTIRHLSSVLSASGSVFQFSAFQFLSMSAFQLFSFSAFALGDLRFSFSAFSFQHVSFSAFQFSAFQLFSISALCLNSHASCRKSKSGKRLKSASNEMMRQSLNRARAAR